MNKKLIGLIVTAVIIFDLTACCTCMNCPGFGQVSGTGSDTICKEDYEASNPSLTWSQFSDQMLQSGCTCIE